MSLRGGARWLSGVLLLAATSSSALAQEAPADADARAQALFQEAWQLVDQKRPAEACVLFRRALELKRTPSILNNVGRCQQQENDLLGAIATFESSVALAEQQPPGPKRESWLEGARRELAALQPQVARLALQLPRTEGLRLELDGQVVAPDAGHVYLMPGRHQLMASAPQRQPHSVELQLAAGAREAYQVPELQPLMSSSPAPASSVEVPVASPPPTLAQEPPPGAQPSSRTLPWALIGTGSAVVVGGVITGLLASSKEGELDEGCPSGSCPSPATDPGWQGKIDDTRRMALVTDVLWGVGLATLGVGVTLLVLDGGDEPAEGAEVQAGCRGGGCGVNVLGRF
jgi:hypothetical protein